MIEMNIKDIDGRRICSVSELDELISPYRIMHIWGFMENFRGQADRNWLLLPGICREGKTKEELPEIEQVLCNNFLDEIKKSNIRDIRDQPFKEEYFAQNRNFWYTMFQAQHLGLRTKLMDWSISWQTALAFAVEDEKYFDIDGSFWVFVCPPEFQITDGSMAEPIEQVPYFEFKENYMINTPLLLFDNQYDILGEKRIGLQNGRFWVQSLTKCIVPLNLQPEYNPWIAEIIVDGKSKRKIKEELKSLGQELDRLYYRKDDLIDGTLKNINKQFYNQI